MKAILLVVDVDLNKFIVKHLQKCRCFYYGGENGEFFYEGQILNHYDNKNNLIGQVLLYKFIRHYHRKDKTPYVCVSIKFLNGNKNDFQTFDAEKFLGNMFTTKIKNFKISIDK